MILRDDLVTSPPALSALLLITLLLLGTRAEAAPPQRREAALAAARQALLERHGADEAARIDAGLGQVAAFWRPEDGDEAALEAFLVAEFLSSGPALDATFGRLEFALERADGYLVSLSRDLRRGVDLEIGELLPIDERLAGYQPTAHLEEDFFSNQIAFVTLLNFPVSSLADKLAQGLTWNRRQWAEARLAGRFTERVPASVRMQSSRALASADSYVSGYNLHLDHVLTEDGRRLFPEGLRLISHWGLRDEIKARYADGEGLAKQRLIARAMDRIVRQEVPGIVIDNPEVDWRPESNRVTKADGEAIAAPREADERYRHLLAIFRAEKLEDPFQPDNPTHVDRRFNSDREIPETEVRALFEALLDSPLAAEVAKLIAGRLGRPLEPFDVWYPGFKPRGSYDEAKLDAITRERYPSAAAFAADLPRILTGLGFTPERARFLAAHVVVEPSRGAGHAFGAARRDDAAHLRTRVGKNGMDYKGYNIAIHELGHNVEQVFSMTAIDHTRLSGVPNTAFTEALAFVFQGRDLELLGLAQPDPMAEHLRALDVFWNAREIAGVALVDMEAWRWMYDHPEATPAELREAVVEIAQRIWNRHYAPLMGSRDQTLLGIYSHMIDGALYLPDYPLGHLIAFQIEDHFRKPGIDFGREFERVCQLGRLTPDAWLRAAVGQPLSAQPLLAATEAALRALGA